MSAHSNSRPCSQTDILILAAGKGTRMVSQLPKVLHPVLFRSMVQHVIDLAERLPHRSIGVVVGHGEDQVREACSGYPHLQFFRQVEQKGTAHAVQMATPFLGPEPGQVLVLSGDVILLRRETLLSLVERHVAERRLCTLLTARPPEARGYGRILRDEQGAVTAIREEKDASPLERAVEEVNAGVYLFERAALARALGRIGDRNAQKEFYLTDVIEILAREPGGVGAETLSDAREMLGVNDRRELARAEAILQERTNTALMLAGVTLQRPDTILIDPRSRIASDVTIGPNCTIIASEIGASVTLESDCRVSGSRIHSGAHLKQGCYVNDSEIGEAATLGPYAHLRPKTVLGPKVKLGNFVETKNARFAEGAKASHLSYIGDAEIGKRVNLGCGFITCNFDGGPEKHRTVIEDDVFVGSDSQTVAPVRVGAGSYVASGTTVTEDVPPQSLAISRGRQITREGYARKYVSRRNPT